MNLIVRFGIAVTLLRNLPDKELAIVIRHEAGRYAIAADTLAERSELELTHPCYFLRCHAIELLLKATLLASGSTLAEVETYNHDLVRAFEDAKKRGLIVSEETAQTIQQLSGLHRRHQFRYLKSSKFEVPFAIAYPNDEASRRSLKDLLEQSAVFIRAANQGAP
jgi:hypothetical protein